MTTDQNLVYPPGTPRAAFPRQRVTVDVNGHFVQWGDEHEMSGVEVDIVPVTRSRPASPSTDKGNDIPEKMPKGKVDVLYPYSRYAPWACVVPPPIWQTLETLAPFICAFCFDMRNLVLDISSGKGLFTRVICDGCRARVSGSPLAACDCGRKRWVNLLGQIAPLCRECDQENYLVQKRAPRTQKHRACDDGSDSSSAPPSPASSNLSAASSESGEPSAHPVVGSRQWAEARTNKPRHRGGRKRATKNKISAGN